MTRLTLTLTLSIPMLLTACDDGGGSGGGGGAGGGGGGSTTTSAQECNLVEDTGGPGKYADTCVKREWAEPYVGVYTSANCKLTLTTPAGGPPAVFELELTDPAIGGTYAHDWEGGAGLGNDSYYVFTTDATFATEKAINFGVGQKVDDNEERSIRFRINDLDTGTPSYTGGFGVTITSPFSNTEADCGVLVKEP